MRNIEIENYLQNRDRVKNIGNCISCKKVVQWAIDRVASHKRASCPSVTDEEKRRFAKRSADPEQTSANKRPSNTNDSNNNSSSQPLTAIEREEIDMKIANFFFRTGISLRLVDSNAFKEMIHSLNPSYAESMTSAKSLSGSLLDKQYITYSQQLNQILENTGNLTLVSDGWTNIRGDHIVNFCVKASGQKPFFYSSIDTSGIVQDSSAIAEAIIKVIEELGPQKFSCVVTDNANVMKAAWKLIEEKFPHISTNGCAAHGVNLLVKDLASTNDNAKTIKEAEKVIKFFRNHHIVKAKLEEKRKAAKIARGLSMPVSTRWMSLYNALNNLQGLKYVIIQLVDEEYDTFKNINPRVTSKSVLDLIKLTDFWTRLSTFIKEIEFPSNVIGKLEGDDSPLSSVYHYFNQMYQKFGENRDIQYKIKKRLEFIYTPSMGLAYILTPKHAAEGSFFNQDKIDIMSSAEEFASKINPEIAGKAQEQIISFIDEMSRLPQKHKDLLFKMTARNYWSIIGKEKYPELYQIAKPICDMICSSATAERVWSTFRFIHSRLRNRLTNDHVRKLVFIYTNSVLLDTVDKNDYILEEGAILSEMECVGLFDD